MDHIQSDKQLVDELGGLPLTVHGYGDGSPGRRRRPVFKESFGADGRRQVHSSFFVKGERGEGKVFLEAYEDEQGRWKEKYLSVELTGGDSSSSSSSPSSNNNKNNLTLSFINYLFALYFVEMATAETRILIGEREVAKIPYKKGWHPFSRFF